jgi:5-methylcytosine-specific restriction endonuclease McrA
MGLQQLQNIRDHRNDPKVKKKYIIPKVSKKRAKQILEQKATLEADKEFYKAIWAASPHWCFECGKKLGREPLTLFFHHLLEKRNYPQFRHTPENITILCPDCHSQVEVDLDKCPKTKERRLWAEKTLLNDL